MRLEVVGTVAVPGERPERGLRGMPVGLEVVPAVAVIPLDRDPVPTALGGAKAALIAADRRAASAKPLGEAAAVIAGSEAATAVIAAVSLGLGRGRPERQEAERQDGHQGRAPQ